jgi:hypothetical protein
MRKNKDGKQIFRNYNKLYFIGLLILITIILFITIIYLNKKLNISSVESFNEYYNYNINATFDMNNKISSTNYNNTIYLDNVNEDIIINELTFEVPDSFNKDKIDIQIVNIDNFKIVKSVSSPIDFVSSSSNVKKYKINNKIGIDILPNINYSLVVIINDTNIYNNPKLYFTLGDLRFRFFYNTMYMTFNHINDNGLYNNFESNTFDNIMLNSFDTNTPINQNSTHNLQPFNMLKFIIEKPNMTKLKEILRNFLFKNDIDNKNYILEEFNKFIPINFEVNIKDITNNTEKYAIPSFKLPNTQSFCTNIDDNINANVNKKNKCILELYNLLPEHTYNIKIKLMYAHSNNFNNIRYSNLYDNNIVIDKNTNNDLLSSSINVNKHNDLTQNLLKNITESNKFNTIQNEQNTNIQNIEKKIDTLMNNYSF